MGIYFFLINWEKYKRRNGNFEIIGLRKWDSLVEYNRYLLQRGTSLSSRPRESLWWAGWTWKVQFFRTGRLEVRLQKEIFIHEEFFIGTESLPSGKIPDTFFFFTFICILSLLTHHFLLILKAHLISFSIPGPLPGTGGYKASTVHSYLMEFRV